MLAHGSRQLRSRLIFNVGQRKMNPDWPLYAACASGVTLGSILALRKRKAPESRFLRPWIGWSSTLALALFAVLTITSSSDHAHLEWRAPKELIGYGFAYGLLLQLILTLSGIVFGVGRLCFMAHTTRKDLS